MELNRTEVLQALARGFCAEKNSHKQMDADLCNAMADEVMALAHLAAKERSVQERGDPMNNWLMKPSIEWLENAEHGENQDRCKMIAAMLRDLWRGSELKVTITINAAVSKGESDGR